MLSKLKLPKLELSPLKQAWFVTFSLTKLLWQTDKKSALSVVLFNTFNSSFILPRLYLDKLFIDTLIASLGAFQVQQSLVTITLIVAARLVLSLFESFFRGSIGYHNENLSRRFTAKMDHLLGKQHSSIDVTTIESPAFKDRFQKIEREGGRSFQLVALFADIPRYVVGIVSSVSIFIFFQPLIVVASLGFLIPSFIVDSKFIKRRYQDDEKLSPKHRLWGLLNYFLTRSRNYLETRILNIQDYLLAKLSRVSDEIISVRLTTLKERQTANFLANIPEYLFLFGLDIYFAFSAITQKITVGSAQAYMRATANFHTNLAGLVCTFLRLYENYLYVSDLMWFLNLRPTKIPDQGKKFPTHIKTGVEFDNVWFKYPESDTWILRGVSFSISSRENIALIGENGAGKTTLIKLLVGVYSVTKGRILIDKVDVANISPLSLWKNIAVLFQDFEGYNFTARESIGYGNIAKVENLTDIKKYATMTEIDNWIGSLPLRYENPLSRDFEKGVSPSFGQWQRIGIARALIKDAPIVILDEPTSSVDPEAEEEIFNQILKLGKAKILIFISHRFSTVRRADKILVLDKGQIVEQGSHEQLMKLDGKYAHLFNLQAKSYQ